MPLSRDPNRSSVPRVSEFLETIPRGHTEHRVSSRRGARRYSPRACSTALSTACALFIDS